MLFVAAVLIAGLGIAHSILGEKYIVGPLLRRSDLPVILGRKEFAGSIIRFAWHVTTVLAVGIAVVLVQVAMDAPISAIVAAIGWTLLVSGLLPLFYTRGRHLAWLVFFAAGTLCLVWSFTA